MFVNLLPLSFLLLYSITIASIPDMLPLNSIQWILTTAAMPLAQT